MKSQKVKKQNKEKVFVGLSGGVDSAVSAALLQKEGYDVTGVFIKAWNPEGFVCTWKEDRRSAMRVAAVLDIPFITLDLEKEYKKEVVDYMTLEYKNGRTPNPDVMCNKEIKFGHFLKFALKNGADFIATGHYSRTLPLGEGRVGLFEGIDKSKDQSYFLWTLMQDQLKHVLFPIGNFQKSEVRKLAEKFGLPQATRKDSQGLCFLGKIDMKEFLQKYIQSEKGKVLNENGEEIGEHGGAVFFTIGERHGFTVFSKTPEDDPLYVISKNIKENTITVAHKKTASQKVLGSPLQSSTRLFSKQFFCELTDVNLNSEISKDKKLECRFRYRQEKVKCKIKIENDKTFIEFEKMQNTITPGQSLVLYHGEICVGGGVIL